MVSEGIVTDRRGTKEKPLPEDIAVCAGCGGRIFKVSRHFYEQCAFCGSRKAKRNPIRPQVCRTCAKTPCRLIPQGRVTCDSRIARPKSATSGKSINVTSAFVTLLNWPNVIQVERANKSMKQKPLTMLHGVPPTTATWMKEQVGKMNLKNDRHVGLCTLARGILTGLASANLDLSSAQGEIGIADTIRKMATVVRGEN